MLYTLVSALEQQEGMFLSQSRCSSRCSLKAARVRTFAASSAAFSSSAFFMRSAIFSASILIFSCRSTCQPANDKLSKAEGVRPRYRHDGKQKRAHRGLVLFLSPFSPDKLRPPFQTGIEAQLLLRGRSHNSARAQGPVRAGRFITWLGGALPGPASRRPTIASAIPARLHTCGDATPSGTACGRTRTSPELR